MGNRIKTRHYNLKSTQRCQVRALPSPDPGLGQGQGQDQDPGLPLRRIRKAPLLEVRVAVALNQYPGGQGLALSPVLQIPGREQDLAQGVHDQEAGQEIEGSEGELAVGPKIRKDLAAYLKIKKDLAVDPEIIIKEDPLCAEDPQEEVLQEGAHLDVGPQEIEIGHEDRLEEEGLQEEVLHQGGHEQEAGLEPQIWTVIVCTWPIWTAMRLREI